MLFLLIMDPSDSSIISDFLSIPDMIPISFYGMCILVSILVLKLEAYTRGSTIYRRSYICRVGELYV